MAGISFGDLAVFRRLILGGFALVLVAFAVQVGLFAWLAAALRSIDPRPGMAHSVPEIGIYMVGAWVLVALGLAIIVTGFCRGIVHVRRSGEGIGLTGFSHSLAWTAWSMLVPLLNLYRPWVGLGEIRRAVFVAQETRVIGNRWNRFGDVSSATIALAAVVMGVAGLEFVYNFLATLPASHTAAEALASFSHIRLHILINSAFIGIQAAALFFYLKTLEPPLRRLSDLADSGGLAAPT
jgi:hypothetical protein